MTKHHWCWNIEDLKFSTTKQNYACYDNAFATSVQFVVFAFVSSKKKSTSVTVVIRDFRLAFYCGCGKWQKYIHYIRTKCSRPTAYLLRLDFEQFHNVQLHVQIMKTRIGEKNGLWQRRTHCYLWIAEGTAALLNEDKYCLVSAHKPL